MVIKKAVPEIVALRLSLTSHCNLTCLYCKEPTGFNDSAGFAPPDEIFKRIESLRATTKIHKIRLTGGEPSLYPYLSDLIFKIKRTGEEQIHMTTNGLLVEKMLPDLKTAGLDGINFSLDAIDQNIYRNLCGKGNNIDVINAILAAKKTGFKIKINATILNNINVSQIIPLLQFSLDHNLNLRFLELMKIGPLNNAHSRYFFAEAEMLKIIKSHYHIAELERVPSATAHYWSLDNNKTFGIIANHSTPFCHDCDRIRIDSKGILYGCLTAASGFEIHDKINMTPVLIQAFAQKKTDRFESSDLSMQHIGG